MAKSQKKSGRETRKTKSGPTPAGHPTGKKVPRYLREGAGTQVEIPSFKPAKKSPPAT